MTTEIRRESEDKSTRVERPISGDVLHKITTRVSCQSQSEPRCPVRCLDTSYFLALVSFLATEIFIWGYIAQWYRMGDKSKSPPVGPRDEASVWGLGTKSRRS